MRSPTYKRRKRGGVGSKSKNEKSQEGKNLKKQLKSLLLDVTNETNPIVKERLQKHLQELSKKYNLFIKRSPQKLSSPKKKSPKLDLFQPLIPTRQKATLGKNFEEDDLPSLSPRRERAQIPDSLRFINFGGKPKTKKIRGGRRYRKKQISLKGLFL